MKKYFAFLFMFSVISIISQVEDQSVNGDKFSVVANNNFNTDNLKVGVGLTFLTRPLDQFDVVANVKAGFLFNKIGSISASGDFSFAPSFTSNAYQFTEDQAGIRISNNKISPYRSYEGGITISIIDKDFILKEAIHLGYGKERAIGGGSVNVEYKAKVKVPVRIVLGPRLGFSSYQSMFVSSYYASDPDVNYSYGFNLYSEDGSFLLKTVPKKPGQLDNTDQILTTSFKVSSPYIGVDFKKILDLEYGLGDDTIHLQSVLNVYFDVFLGGQLVMDDVIIESALGIPQYYNIAYDNGLTLRNKGFRIGVSSDAFGRSSGLNMTLEAGKRPGLNEIAKLNLLGNKWYVLFKIKYLLKFKI